MEPDDGAMAGWPALPPEHGVPAISDPQPAGNFPGPSRAASAIGGAAGTFGLAALAGVAAGAGGGAVAGTLTLPLVGTVFGLFIGAAVAAVPGLVLAGVAAAVAAGLLATDEGTKLLPRVLAAVGAAAAAVVAVPVGWALLDPAGIFVSIGVWSTILFEAVLLGWVGKTVAGRTAPQDRGAGSLASNAAANGTWF